jgi:two-component system response regulator MprA
VVVIDDDDGVREILTLALRAEGYDVRTARNGVEGLAILRAGRADLVLADVRMPEIDGRAFCRSYAQEQDAGPVILLTAVIGGAAAADLPGVVETVSKPFDLEYLLGLVARSVDTP